MPTASYNSFVWRGGDIIRGSYTISSILLSLPRFLSSLPSLLPLFPHLILAECSLYCHNEGPSLISFFLPLPSSLPSPSLPPPSPPSLTLSQLSVLWSTQWGAHMPSVVSWQCGQHLHRSAFTLCVTLVSVPEPKPTPAWITTERRSGDETSVTYNAKIFSTSEKQCSS